MDCVPETRRKRRGLVGSTNSSLPSMPANGYSTRMFRNNIASVPEGLKKPGTSSGRSIRSSNLPRIKRAQSSPAVPRKGRPSYRRVEWGSDNKYNMTDATRHVLQKLRERFEMRDGVFTQFFRTLDKNGDNTVDADEIKSFFNQFTEYGLEPDEVDNMIDCLDHEGKGFVQYADFHQAFEAAESRTHPLHPYTGVFGHAQDRYIMLKGHSEIRTPPKNAFRRRESRHTPISQLSPYRRARMEQRTRDLVAKLKRRINCHKSLRETFRDFDTDYSGNIDLEEVRNVFERMNEDGTSEELDRVMEVLDKNNDGLITYAELCEVFADDGVSEEKIHNWKPDPDDPLADIQCPNLSKIAGMVNKGTIHANTGQMMRAFTTYDKEKLGFISAQDFKKALKEMPQELGLRPLLDADIPLESSKEGVIDYRQFMHRVKEIQHGSEHDMVKEMVTDPPDTLSDPSRCTFARSHIPPSIYAPSVASETGTMRTLSSIPHSYCSMPHEVLFKSTRIPMITDSSPFKNTNYMVQPVQGTPSYYDDSQRHKTLSSAGLDIHKTSEQAKLERIDRSRRAVEEASRYKMNRAEESEVARLEAKARQKDRYDKRSLGQCLFADRLQGRAWEPTMRYAPKKQIAFPDYMTQGCLL